MQTTGWRNRQMHNRASVPGVGSGSWLAMVLLLACSPAARPQGQPALPTLGADQVVQRLMEKNKERADTLQHYIGRRIYRLEYRGFPASADAAMEVEVNFDAPATKRFTIVNATGSTLIQNRVFHRLLESEEQAGDSSTESTLSLVRTTIPSRLPGPRGQTMC
jgi:hypothetical protein